MNGAPTSPRSVEPCWNCVHWGGVAENGANGLCARPGHEGVKAQPEYSCAFYVREPGSDDDGWRPLLQGNYDMGKSYAVRAQRERERLAAPPRPRQWWEEPPRPRRPAPAPAPMFDLSWLGSVTGFEILDE